MAVASSTFAQESSRGDFQELCLAMKGRWVGELTCVLDWPGFGKKGETLNAHGEVVVAADGNALIDKFYAGNGSGVSLIVFDPGAKQIKVSHVNSGGGVHQSVYYKSNGKWVYKAAGSNPDGTRYEFISTITITEDGDTQTWTGPFTVGGRKVGEQHDVWRRVSK
jgi:hypothetical protein